MGLVQPKFNLQMHVWSRFVGVRERGRSEYCNGDQNCNIAGFVFRSVNNNSFCFLCILQDLRSFFRLKRREMWFYLILKRRQLRQACSWSDHEHLLCIRASHNIARIKIDNLCACSYLKKGFMCTLRNENGILGV